jgi:hypothetical protein
MDQDTIARSPRKVLESLLLLSLYCRRPQYWCTFCLGSTPALSTAAAINTHGHADPSPPPTILPTVAAINAHADPQSSPPPPQSTAWKVHHYRGRRHLVLRAGVTTSMEGLPSPPRPAAKTTFERRIIQSWLNGGTSPAPSPTSRCCPPHRSSPTTQCAAS